MLDERTTAVLGLYARGMTTAEVADGLGMTRDDVRARLAEAMRELGAASKLDAVVRAMRAGLIDA